METLDELSKIIKQRLISKSGNLKLSENIDIIEFGKRIGISENQLLFKILEIEETISWSVIEEMNRMEVSPRAENRLLDDKLESVDVIIDTIKYCGGCNAENKSASAKFCIVCGAALKQPQAPLADLIFSIDQEKKEKTTQTLSKKTASPIFIFLLGLFSMIFLSFFFLEIDNRGSKSPKNNEFVNSLFYNKTSSGLEYKIYSGSENRETLKLSEFVKFDYKITFNDSVIVNSYGALPGYDIVESPGRKYDFAEILRLMKVGDSAVIIQLYDSILANNPKGTIPFLKMGDKLKTTIKILQIFKTRDLVMEDYENEIKRNKKNKIK